MESKDKPTTADRKCAAKAGVAVTYFAVRSGGQVASFEARVTKALQDEDERVDLEFDFEVEPRKTVKRNASGVRRGAGAADAPCWSAQ